jgi:hypothetical protein
MLAGDATAPAIAASQSSLRREMNCDVIGSLMVIPSRDVLGDRRNE